MTYFDKLLGVNFTIVIGGFSLKHEGGKSFEVKRRNRWR